MDEKAEPITATPSVPPTCRVVSLTAEPTPALAGGSASMIDAVDGALVSPRPPPSSTICAAISAYPVLAPTAAVQAKPTAIEARPPATTVLVPSSPAARAPSTDAAAVAIANGARRAPASNGE